MCDYLQQPPLEHTCTKAKRTNGPCSDLPICFDSITSSHPAHLLLYFFCPYKEILRCFNLRYMNVYCLTLVQTCGCLHKSQRVLFTWRVFFIFISKQPMKLPYRQVSILSVIQFRILDTGIVLLHTFVKTFDLAGHCLCCYGDVTSQTPWTLSPAGLQWNENTVKCSECYIHKESLISLSVD